VAWLFVASGIAYFLNYEVLHTAYHLPEAHWLARNGLVKRLRWLHTIHHDPRRWPAQLQHQLPGLCDWLFGTLSVRAQAIALAVVARRDRGGALEQLAEGSAVAVAAALDDLVEGQVRGLQQRLGALHAQVLDVRDRLHAQVAAEVPQQAALGGAAVLGQRETLISRCSSCCRNCSAFSDSELRGLAISASLT
jgi:hypothetical protein